MKNIVRLSIIDNLSRNLKEGPEFIQVILGPRQVGKTTSILNFLENEYKGTYVFASADSLFNASTTWLKEKWQEARLGQSLLVIDEIQKIENWSEVVKSLWDEDKRKKSPILCVLLGSSSLELQRGLTESLTGRFQLIQAFHWNFHESQAGYGLSFEEYLKYGGYPGSYSIRKSETWVSYLKQSIVETVIEKDILLNHSVKSPALFKQAFEIVISYPAQEISYTKLLGQLQDKGNTDLIKHYIKLYEGALLIKALEKFSTNKIKVRSSSPKILPLCPAFYYLNILAEYSPIEKGRVFELIVGAQLVRLGLDLYYWREGSNEVDYVIKRGRKIWAIEVKSGRKKSSKGLEAFKSNFPSSIGVIITFENYLDFEKDPMTFLEKL
ncbi:MAG TPA: ATP-binding protein [Bacteriovoracaceae bacterium]|nr:ATP-binding protein [Bacteriovoracaceae bacterium]